MTTTTTSRRRRHPALAGTPPGVWNPAAVGVVPGYAQTEAAHRARRERSAEAARSRWSHPDPKDQRTTAEALADGLDRTASARDRLKALRTTLARVRPAE